MDKAGLKSGIPHLMKVAEEIAHAAGLSKAKITSDIKHIEIGLTDKSDSTDWILKSIIEPDQIPHSKVSDLGRRTRLSGEPARERCPHENSRTP